MMLTKRQKQIFDYVKDSIERNGFAPSLVEICQYLKLHSISTVHKHLLHLEEKGLIRRQWNRARAIEIVPVRSKLEARELPLIGLISEGVGIEAVRVNEMVSIPANMIGHRDVFVLRMKGDSMAEDQVLRIARMRVMEKSC